MDMLDESLFEEEAGKPASISQRLRNMAEQVLDLDAAVTGAEEMVKSLKEQRTELLQKKIPTLMAEEQIPSIGCGNGITIDLQPFVSGSLPKEDENPEKRKAAIAWLEESEHADLLQTTVTIVFRKSQHNEALDLVERLKEEKLPVKVEFGVHASSLQAMARQALKDGDEIPLETLGLFAGVVAKIKKKEG